MDKRTTQTILRDIEIFCDELNVAPETLANWIKYPAILERLKSGQRVKPQTIEGLYIEMELRRFKKDVKGCSDVREAVQVAYKFLKGRDVDLT